MFKVILLEERDGKVEAAPRELDEARLPAFEGEGGVTVAIEYTTLNYKDGMILNGIGRLVRDYPHVPGIDFAGRVAVKPAVPIAMACLSVMPAGSGTSQSALTRARVA